MNENEIYEILNSYKQALDVLLTRIESLEQTVIDNKADTDKRIKEVSDTLIEDVINPATEAREWAAKEERFDDFMTRNGEKFAPYESDIKLIEGEDYDLPRKAFETFESMSDEERPTEEEYVDSTIEKVVAQIDKIKEAFGANKVEVKSTGDGETEIKVDGEKVDEKVVEQVVEGEENAEESEEATADELAEFEKELENYKE
mgnify:FL=1